MSEQLVVSAAPHVREPDSIRKIMWTVAAALAPAALAGMLFFGTRALWVIGLSVLSAELVELACLAARGRPWTDALDGSAFVTGLLLAMILPVSVPWYVPVVGALLGIAVVKHCFGGLGHNIWNPALAGRIFVQFAYPQEINLSAWPKPVFAFGGLGGPVATTQASPLFKGASLEGVQSYLDLFLGSGIPGSLGETCKVLLLAGGVFLIVCRYVDWRVPVFYIGTVFALSAVLPQKAGSPPWLQDPVYQILSGGLFLGAFFMATDMVTSPITKTGRVIFAVGCGLVTTLIRFYGGYPEGVAYSIFFMNTTVPLIDRWTRPSVFGSKTLSEQAG
jgi:electron transport complex protein RnfD